MYLYMYTSVIVCLMRRILHIYILIACIYTYVTIYVDMALDFQGFESASLVLAVILVMFVLQKGFSTYLDGMMLLGAYIIVCGAAWAE